MFVANDQSGSVSAIENNQSRQFITALMGGMQPWGNASGESRMAIADWASPGNWLQFSYPSVAQNYTTLISDVIAYQNAPRSLSGGTGPYSALLNTFNSLNQTPVPGRISDKIIVLMTDAACSQVPAGISTLATQIKNSGVFIIVVAIEAASSCPSLAGTNVASPGGYFSASNYSALIQANVQLVQDIITTACLGAISPSYDLLITLDDYTASNCSPGPGTYTVDLTIYNAPGAGDIFNDEILISYYNGDPQLPTTNLLTVQSDGVHSIPIGGSYSGTITSPLFSSSSTIYAVVNYDGSLAGNAPPVSPYLVGSTYVLDELITYNNFSNGITRVGDASCPPFAIITTDVVCGGVGCDNLVSYEVTICNTGDAPAFLNTTLPIPVPGAVLINNINVPVETTGDLQWATYYGDTDQDHGYSTATDPSGNVYLAGFTESTINIATVGAHQTAQSGGTDAFLIKFDTDGVRLWGTYFGGDENDKAFDVATDNVGNVYIVGNTESQNSIATAGAYQTAHNNSDDGFIAKFNGAGVLQWASYYGGAQVDFGRAVATDASNDVYLAGYTEGSTILASAGGHQTVFAGTADLFLVKFNSTGARQWATYYGGTGEDLFPDVATDPSGNVYLAAQTQSATAISTAGAHQTVYNGDDDVFLAKFNTAGVRQWGTYYGGTQTEKVACVATDPSGNIYFGGETNSASSIATVGSHQSAFGGLWDAFLAKFNTGGVRQWGTYFGGTAVDAARGATTDLSGNVYITGPTASANNIATIGAYQTSLNGQDAYLAKFNTIGENQWGTYYGGLGTEEGFGVATDALSSIYIAGVTASTTLIATANGHQTTYGTLEDAYLAKFNDKDIGSIININECITQQYIYDLSAVAPGNYDFSFGVIADTVNLGDATPIVIPDSNFAAGSYSDVDGFNGALHSTDDITVVSGGPNCPPGDQISISVDIPITNSCGSGNFAQATITINNTSGITAFGTELHLNLTGLGATFAGELYNLPAGLLIPAPAILDPAYPAVPYALFNQSGDQYLPILEIPAGISTFNVDINAGSAITNLSAQIDSIHSSFNLSGQSNLATDAQGLNISPYPTISGFSCPSSINAGSNIVFNGISTSSASSIEWSSTTVASLPNTGTLTNPAIIYIPTPIDVANGFVEVSLNVTSAAGCETTVSCQVIIANVLYDYGDAPITYDLNINFQPPAAASTLFTGLFLGLSGPGTENIANNSMNADGDGLEEDGLVNPYVAPWPAVGQTHILDIQLTNTSNEFAYLNAYIDWNTDGDFLDSLESALSVASVPSLSGTQQYPLQFTVPPAVNTAGVFFIRLRLSTDSTAVTTPYLAAPYGETEDYVWISVGPLPIELLGFTAQDQGSSVKIDWVTASETNNDYFVLERSANGLEYSPIEQIQGAGNSTTTLYYHHQDLNPLDGVSYYRLKQVDNDGAFEYFGPVAMTRANKSDIWLEYLSEDIIHVHGYDMDKMALTVYDIRGRIQALNITTNGQLDISILARGIYVLSISKNGQYSERMKFEVR